MPDETSSERSIRKSTAEDVHQIINLVKASWARTYDPIIGFEARKAKSDAKHVPALFLAEIVNENAASIVAEVGGRIVGHVGGQIRPTSQNQDTFFVDHLHVDPAFHGKGIASALMKALAGNITEIATCIELTVLENNARALAFYEKMGFLAAKGDNEDDGMGGIPSVLMRWEITK